MDGQEDGDRSPDNTANESLWFDSNGICYQLLGTQTGNTSLTGKPQSTSTPSNLAVTGAVTRTRLAAAMPAVLEEAGDTFLSKTIRLVMDCMEWWPEGQGLRNKLTSNDDDVFNKVFVHHAFISMLSATCRNLDIPEPFPDMWADRLKMFKVFVEIFNKYEASEEEKDFIDSMMEEDGSQTEILRKKYHECVAELVNAKYIDKELLDPETSEHAVVMLQFWTMSFEAEMVLRANNKAREVLRIRVVDVENFKEMVDREIAATISDTIIPHEFEEKRHQIVQQGVALENDLKTAIDALVFAWIPGFKDVNGEADATKLLVVCDFGAVTVIYPAQTSDLGYLAAEDHSSVSIVEEDADLDTITERFTSDIKLAIERLEARKADLENAWGNLISPTSATSNSRRHSMGLAAAVVSGLERSARRQPPRVVTSPRSRLTPPAVTLPPATPTRSPEERNPSNREQMSATITRGLSGNGGRRVLFDTVDMNVTRVVTCPLTGRVNIRPGNPEEDVPPRSAEDRSWGLGAGGGMRSSGFNNMANGTGDIIVKRINEVNVLQRGLPQLISINERMTLDQLQFLEADISAMSEAVKSISQLQRELDKFGVQAPDVDLYTDGGTSAGKVSTSNWVNRMTRETSLLINRVKQRVKTKQEGEIEAQRALLKSALDFKVPMLDQPSQYLKWATFNKEVFIQSAATREAASANPGFLLGLKQKLKGSDILDTSLCSSAQELFAVLDVKYLATGYAVHMAFTHTLGVMPRVMDIKEDPGVSFSRKSMQMVKNISQFLEIMTYVVKLDQFDHLRDEHVTAVEDRLFSEDYYKIYMHIANKFALASEGEKESMLAKRTFGQADLSILDESTLGASLSTSILDETPLHLRMNMPKELISLDLPPNRKLSPSEYCKLLVILSTTVKGMTSYERIREAMRPRTQGYAARADRKKTVSFTPGTPINNLDLDQDLEDGEILDEGINVTGVSEKKSPIPKAPCPLQCGHRVALGSAKWCKKFRKMKVPERLLAVRDTPLCPKCLAKKHPAGVKCQAKITCFVCKSDQHNTYLHEDENIADMNNVEAEEDEGLDLSFYMTDELEAELEEVDINLTHLGDLKQGDTVSEIFNAISYDAEALSILKKMIEKAKPKSVVLESDSWTEEKREKSYQLFNKLKKNILDAKAEHLEELEKEDLDANLTELTQRFRNSSRKVGDDNACQSSSFVHFLRPGETLSRAPRPEAGERLDQALVQQIMRDNSDMLCSNYSNEINMPYTKASPASFDNIMDIQGALSEICPVKQLTFAWVDIVIEDMSEEKLRALANMKDVRVRCQDDQWLCTVNALLDEGSSTNLTLTQLIDALAPRRLHRIKATITTVNGSSTLIDFKYGIDIRVGPESVHSMASVKMNQISDYKPLTKFELACLEHILGLDEETVKWFNISPVPVKTYFLIGCEEGDLSTIRILDSASLGLKFNLLSQRIKITYVPFAAGPKLSVSGSFGVSPKLISREKRFPSILLPKRDSLDRWVWDETRRFRKLLESPLTLTRSSALCQALDEQDGVNMATVNHIEISHQDRELGEAFEEVNFTQTDAKTLMDYLQGEKALLTPFLLCPAHEKVKIGEASNCKDCSIRNQNSAQGKELARYNQLWDCVSVVEWMTKQRIMLNMPFDRAPEQLGEKFHSNIVPAFKASVSLYKKCVKEDSLLLIDGQFRSRVANNQLTPLTESEVAGIMDGSIKSNFILRGKVNNMNSESSPSRVICNTAHKIDFSGSSLVTCDPCPNHDLVELLSLSLKTFVSPTMALADVKGAYLSIGLTEPTKFFYINIWFLEPHKYGTRFPICYKSENLDFGFGSASVVLRIGILKYGVPKCKMIESKETLKENTYVDNLGFLTIPDTKTLGESLVDVKTSLDSLNLVVDKFYLPKEVYDDPGLDQFKEKFNIEFKPRSVTLGLSWCCESDSVVPATKLSIFPTHRGIPTGEAMRKTDLNKTPMTRRSTSRCIAQVWCNSGRFLAIAQASAKWLLTRVCKILSLTEMDIPIIERDQELGLASAAFWTDLSRTEIAPFRRCTVRKGWIIIALVVDHDASISLCGAVIYVISEDVNGNRESQVLSAKSTLSWATVISNEMRGHAVASHLLITVVSAIAPVLKAYNFSPVFCIITDNLPSCFLYREDSKQTLTRNVRHTVFANLATLFSLMPLTSVTHCWLPSRFLSSDLLTKFFPNPGELINSDKWRHGAPEFLRFESLSHFWFLKATTDEVHYRELPTTLVQNDKMSFSELVENNPLREEDLYQVHFDQSRDKVREMKPQKKDDVVTDDLILNMVRDVSIEVNIDNFLADAEVESAAGCHNDDYNRAYISTYTNAMMTANRMEPDVSHEWVNAVLLRQETKQSKNVRSIDKCNIATFTSGANSVKARNVIDTVEQLEDFDHRSHLGKNLYDDLMNRTFNIVKIINMVILMLRMNPKWKDSGDTLMQRVWAMLLLSDQLYYPADHSSLRGSMVRIKNIWLVALRPHNLMLPLLNASSPLMTRILYTVHRHPTDVDRFPDQHVPLGTLKNIVLRSFFGVYCTGLTKTITRMLSKCSRCLRTMLRKFKVPQGERFALINPDADLFHQCSVDPLGPVIIKSHTKSRRSTLQCFILVIVCHQSGCVVMEIIGDLTHQSIILGLKQAEQRYNFTLNKIYFDAGSSLSAKLLENELRPWQVFQHPPTSHSRVYSESKISVLKPMWNKLFGKFSKENKVSCPISLFELYYIASHLQLQMNQQPYSEFSSFAPATLLHARGLEVSQMFKDLEEAESGVEPMDRLTTWLQTMRDLRNEMLGDIMTQRSSLKEVNTERFYPMSGDICVALIGDEKKCDLVTVVDDGLEEGESDAQHQDQQEDDLEAHQKIKLKSKRKDGKEKLSMRTVLVRSGKGKPKPYPVGSLRLLSEGDKRRKKRLAFNGPAENPF